jgi:hypothetical protein
MLIWDEYYHPSSPDNSRNASLLEEYSNYLLVYGQIVNKIISKDFFVNSFVSLPSSFVLPSDKPPTSSCSHSSDSSSDNDTSSSSSSPSSHKSISIASIFVVSFTIFSFLKYLPLLLTSSSSVDQETTQTPEGAASSTSSQTPPSSPLSLSLNNLLSLLTTFVNALSSICSELNTSSPSSPGNPLWVPVSGAYVLFVHLPLSLFVRVLQTLLPGTSGGKKKGGAQKGEKTIWFYFYY